LAINEIQIFPPEQMAAVSGQTPKTFPFKVSSKKAAGAVYDDDRHFRHVQCGRLDQLGDIRTEESSQPGTDLTTSETTRQERADIIPGRASGIVERICA
jgi:hypothetical protein